MKYNLPVYFLPVELVNLSPLSPLDEKVQCEILETMGNKEANVEGDQLQISGDAELKIQSDQDATETQCDQEENMSTV